MTGQATELRLGNLDAARDWGFAGDYVEAMWRMLQQPEPDDYVIGTGTAHTVREFVVAAFQHVNLDWQQYVKTDAKLLRPAEVEHLIANPAKAQARLGWTPRVTFQQLVQLMVDADIQQLESSKKTARPTGYSEDPTGI